MRDQVCSNYSIMVRSGTHRDNSDRDLFMADDWFTNRKEGLLTSFKT